ncbi:MAG: hypothetical protein DRJ42_29015 [Deltaproteobacteria bacterium]|nr:MAG: hypothetical protein DRJ42_29015 [Deltaproteobacteria bacterium]
MARRFRPSRLWPSSPAWLPRPAVLALALGLALSIMGAIAGGGPALGQNGPDDGDGDGDGQPTCIEHRGEARYRGYGYQHVVIIDNGCDQDARCEVATDVTPESQNVDVPAGETKEIITRNGSPSRAFEPRVSCSLQ